jgi:hypothetical protein
MTIEIVLLVLIVALISSGASIWAFGYVLHGHKQRILEMYGRLNYLEVGMHYHELIPLPWELEDPKRDPSKTKYFKHEGNVVYLQSED